jgi:hypothetical protein
MFNNSDDQFDLLPVVVRGGVQVITQLAEFKLLGTLDRVVGQVQLGQGSVCAGWAGRRVVKVHECQRQWHATYLQRGMNDARIVAPEDRSLHPLKSAAVMVVCIVTGLEELKSPLNVRIEIRLQTRRKL